MHVLFIHGGGDDASGSDLEIVRRLREALGTAIPLEHLRFEGLVVAQSAGGVAALKLLSGSGDLQFGICFSRRRLTFPNDFAEALDANLNVAIYHSKDDATIPVEDALLYFLAANIRNSI